MPVHLRRHQNPWPSTVRPRSGCQKLCTGARTELPLGATDSSGGFDPRGARFAPHIRAREVPAFHFASEGRTGQALVSPRPGSRRRPRWLRRRCGSGTLRTMTNLGSDVAVGRDWWLELAPEVPAAVRGLWFGLFVTSADDGSEQHAMYVSGTREFATGDGGEWASDTIWEPAGRYVRLPGLAEIAAAEWRVALDHAVQVVTAIEPWMDAPASLYGVGSGFDDGDVVVVWART